LVNAIRTIFQNNNCAHVSAPAGSAAFYRGGETMHRLFKLNCRKSEVKLFAEEDLVQKTGMAFQLKWNLEIILLPPSLCPGVPNSLLSKVRSQIATNGAHHFITTSETTMELQQIMHNTNKKNNFDNC
jgi:hypothetical protein